MPWCVFKENPLHHLDNFAKNVGCHLFNSLGHPEFIASIQDIQTIGNSNV